MRLLLLCALCVMCAAYASAQEESVTVARLPVVQPDSYPLAEAAAAAVTTASNGIDSQTLGWHKPGNPYFNKPLYLYNWCGLAPESNSTDTNDYVATIDATPGSSTFGKVIDISNSPYSRTEAHHCGVDKAGKWFGAGGLLAFLQKEADGSPLPDALFWDLSDPAHPKYSHGLYTPGGACTDEFRSTKDGGFAVSNMCGRTGSYGGGWFKVHPGAQNLTEYAPVATFKKRDQKTFNPHGIDMDDVGDTLITSDFINVASTIITEMNQNPTPILQTTVRIWRYSTGEVLKTINLGKGNAAGVMDARRVPDRVLKNGIRIPRRNLYWVTNGLGHLYLIDGNRYTAQRVYCLKEDCSDLPGTCIQGNPFKGGTRMLAASYALDQLRLVDISDPWNVKTLDIYQMPKGAGGHVVKYDEATSIAALSTYFLDIPGTILRYNADQKVSLFYIDLKTDKIKLMGAVDFTDAVATKGPSSCHGAAFNTYYEY